MSKLFNSIGDEIDVIISQVLPKKVARKIKNELLNGQVQTQTIGTARTELEVTCDGDEVAKEIIEGCYTEDEPIELQRKGKYYIGLIPEAPGYTQITSDWYTIKFILAVNEEGDI